MGNENSKDGDAFLWISCAAHTRFPSSLTHYIHYAEREKGTCQEILRNNAWYKHSVLTHLIIPQC